MGVGPQHEYFTSPQAILKGNFCVKVKVAELDVSKNIYIGKVFIYSEKLIDRLTFRSAQFNKYIEISN